MVIRSSLVADEHDGAEAAERLGDQRDLAGRGGLHRRCRPGRRSRRRSGSRGCSAGSPLPETGAAEPAARGVRNWPRFGDSGSTAAVMSAGSGAAALGGGGDRGALAGLGVGVAGDPVGVADDRDQQLLVLAHREVGPEAVPRGERGHRDAVEPGDRVGGLARLDAVADRVDQRLGLAVLERVVGRQPWRPAVATVAPSSRAAGC